MFQGFKYLSHLYISEANITSIEADSFQSLPYLTTLSITRSGLSNINFGDLGGIEILDLYENPKLNVSGYAKDLQILNLNDCDLTELPYELIKHSKDIILSARYNRISEIPLEAIARTKLTDLSFNQIHKLSDASGVSALIKMTGNPLECHCPDIKIFLNGQYRGRVFCAGPPEFADILVNHAIEKCHRLKREVILSRSTRGDIDSMQEENEEGSGVSSSTEEEGSGGGVFITSDTNVPVVDDNDSDEDSSRQPVEEPIIINVTAHQDTAINEDLNEDEDDKGLEELLKEIEKTASESTTTTTTTEDPLYKKYHKTDIDQVDLISEIPDISQNPDNETTDFIIPLYNDLVNKTTDAEELTSPRSILETSTLDRLLEEPRVLHPGRGDIPGINEPGVGSGVVAEPTQTSVGMIILFATLSIIGIVLLAMACRRNRSRGSPPAPQTDATNAKEMKSLLEQPEKAPKNANDYVIIPLKDDEEDGHRKENGNGTVLVHNTPPSNGGPVSIENGHLAPPKTSEQQNGDPRVSDSDDEVVRVLVTERFYPESLPRTPERIHKDRLSPKL